MSRDPDGLVESWRPDRSSAPVPGPASGRHTHLEIIASDRQGAPLASGAPVPGCNCATCITLSAGGSPDEALLAETLVRDLARIAPEDREKVAAAACTSWITRGVVLPRPEHLAALAARVPGARREYGSRSTVERHPGPGRGRSPLPVERARKVPITEVAAQLGLGEPVGRWGEPRVLCPFHDDSDPSLRLDPDRGLWYCDPCGIGGDGIELFRRATGLPFGEAVRRLAPATHRT